MYISIHALRVEGDCENAREASLICDFYPRPPGGGRLKTHVPAAAMTLNFYPRPPGGGRLGATRAPHRYSVDFYPRPPGGGRPDDCKRRPNAKRFLSTPSGWRATSGGWRIPVQVEISIHALRVEGDQARGWAVRRLRYFYPRPPGGGRRLCEACHNKMHPISIHALRVEGDAVWRCADRGNG